MAGHRLREDRVKKGLCETCGETRGEKGTARQCRLHADERNRKQAARNRKARRSRKRRRLCLYCDDKRVRGSQLCETHKILQRGYEKRSRLKAASPLRPAQPYAMKAKFTGLLMRAPVE